ncbi:Tudor domain-containing protein 1 [Frankliniella fusca]|uniref:Tudor domain-containing protein 1 n=2 Tax=Frankliniella fusca TaxID=407009 RepID=A0AAE1LJ58_9NEOP|nr:Tudor domain-containing protein 1 [Frankliniella fusca]
MEAHNSDVPIWPSNAGKRPRQMTLLSGAPRWYLWMREENQQAIAALRRDLLLLHENGDLEMFRGNNLPSNGTYVTALHDGKMIRGRICPSQTSSEDRDVRRGKQKIFPVIDIDEGKTVYLPLNQLRILPSEMKSLACQAVRCDIGMDCVEQFDWPTQLNSMLLKALRNFFLLVENTGIRPGSIPTISANITICNPSSGDCSSIQSFLFGTFAMHLDLCSMEKFKPFPVGSGHLVRQNSGTHQQPELGSNIQSLPSNILPLPFHSSSMSLITPPNGPQNFPNFPPCLPLLPHLGLPQGILPSPNAMQPNGHMPPLSFGPNSLAGSSSVSVTSSVINFVGRPPQSKSSNESCNESNQSNRSYSSLSSFALSEYGSAESNFGVELEDCPTSRSSSDRDPKVQEPLNKQKQVEVKAKIEEGVEEVPCKDVSQNSDSLEINVPQLNVSSSSPSCSEKGQYGNISLKGCRMEMEGTDCSSSLSIDAPPFIPRNKSPASNVQAKPFVPRSKSSITNAEAPPFVPRVKSLSPNPEAPPFIPKTKGLVPSTDVASLELTGKVTQKKSFKPDVEAPLFERKNESLTSSTIPQSSIPSKRESKVAFTRTNKIPNNEDLPALKKASPQPSPDVMKKSAAQKEICINADSQQPSCSSANSFPKGPDVELPQIVRKWKIGEIVPAVIAKVWNPTCFEVNVVDEFCELLDRIQEEMADYYKSTKVLMSSKQQAFQLCGNFCACYDVDEDIWFRGEVDEWFMDDSVMPLKVWSVDYGGYVRVDLGSIQPLSSELACTSPRLVTICSMRNIQPRSKEDIWPQIHLDRVKELLPEDKEMYLRIDGNQSEEFVWPVSVFTDATASMQSINEILVAEGCAYYKGCLPRENKKHVPESDQVYEEVDNPMEEAYNIGGNNYDIDDEDACVAVSGWKPTEEAGICWFYNREGYCYKSYCELKHVRLNPDGLTIEKRELHTSSFEDIQDLLSPGKTIKLVVTRILTVHHFMASLKFEKGSIRSRETLSSVLKNLNSTAMKRSLKTFTEYPADGEIVLFRDSKSNMFFRGRIITSSPNDDDLYQVLNVDNGYIRQVPLKDLRRVDPAFLHHPFQAVECWLADVAPTNTDREWIKSCNTVFADMVSNTKLSATIIRSSPWGIEVNLMDKDGNDIAVLLKEMNILKSCPMRHLPLPGSHQIPG